MLRWLLKIPGIFLRLAAVTGIAGMLLGVLSMQLSPEEWIVPSFFGLTFPLWALLCCTGLIYAIARRRWFWLILTSLTLVLNHKALIYTFGSPSLAAEESPAFGNGLGVSSYNVRLFDLYNWSTGAETKQQIFDFLELQKSDVYCFQEFYFTERKGVFDTREPLVDLLACPHVHERYTHEMNGKQYFGVVTMSRYPIVNRGEIAFASDANNFCIFSDIEVGGDTLRVYNGHLSSIRFQKEDYSALDSGPNRADAERLWMRMAGAYKRRASQVKALNESIAESPHPVIVCVDLNDTPVSFAYASLREGLSDASEGKGFGLRGTHIGVFPFLRIDYLLHDASLVCEEFTLHSEVALSDHHPLSAQFRW